MTAPNVRPDLSSPGPGRTPTLPPHDAAGPDDRAAGDVRREGTGDWREQCQWAACTLLAVAHTDGWWHCEPHLSEHRRLRAEDRAARRPRAVIPDWRERIPGLHARGLTDRQIAAAMPCAVDTARDWCRHLGFAPNLRSRAVRPCGTRAAYQRHRQHHEEPCEACRVAERDYQAERYQRRAAS